jgi:hypothetical protein
MSASCNSGICVAGSSGGTIETEGGLPEDAGVGTAVAEAAVTSNPGLDGSIDLDALSPPAGLAGFAFVVNGVSQTPLACPAEDWEYPPPAAQVGPVSDSGFISDTICNGGVVPCPGLSVFLVNTGAYPVAYTAQTSWSVGGAAGQPPGVPFGNSGELSGVLDAGGQVDITSIYAGGIVAVLGSSRPFADPDAGKYVADGATIPWPTGVSGSEGAGQMYVAEIEIVDSCHTPIVVW